MNSARRKEIKKIIERLQECSDMIERVYSDEEDYLNNIPENLQVSERYEKSEEAVDNLESAGEILDDVVECLEAAMV